jgi:hypothetical protein
VEAFVGGRWFQAGSHGADRGFRDNATAALVAAKTSFERNVEE